MTNIKFLLIGTSLSFIPTITFAQCVATQDCETLGYTETSCNGGKGVKCPFGNKWACLTSEEECLNLACDKLGFTYTCTGTGEQGVGNACNGKYQSCTCDSSYKYICTGTGYSGGSGTACGGKYTACTCASGYEWKNGSCQKKILNGAQGELYYCNGTVVGVRATDMDFYVAIKNFEAMTWPNAKSLCQGYAFCGKVKGTLPTLDQLKALYRNKWRVDPLLSTNGGTQLADGSYWSSNEYYGDNGYLYGYYVVNMSNGGTIWVASYPNNYSTANARPVLTSW